ncbi:hypothetical protein D3C87_1711030 [compost metagenome]
MRHLHAVVDAADDQAFFAPVELEGLAELEGQWNERGDVDRLSLALAPGSNEVSDGRVTAVVARRLDLGVQRTCCAPLMLGPSRIGRQCPLQRFLKRAELVGAGIAPVLRRLLHRRAQPLGNRVARQSRPARYLALRQLVPRVQPSDLANHVHGDHSSNPAA